MRKILAALFTAAAVTAGAAPAVMSIVSAAPAASVAMYHDGAPSMYHD